MGRKKKEEKVINYDWSPYQKAIFKFVESGQGHLVVEAVAGSGKTATLVKCLEYIPNDKKVLVVAFNKDIVTELEKKTKVFENVDVRTMHSLGLAICRRNIETISPQPSTFKYETYIRENLKQLSSINIFKLKGTERYRYITNIKKYIDFGRCYLAQTVKDMTFIEERYGIDTIADEKEIAVEVLKWGKNSLESIDYSDMVWLPTELNLKPLGLLYDYIFVDECQDMNKAERELIYKCFKMGTRMFSFGDSQQAIYSFSGADIESFKELKNKSNTTSLPLSISYRCSKNIVDFAKKLVPSIEANNDGREGIVKDKVSLNEVQDGDMIICRNNAPLIQIYNEFLKLGKKCFIRGKEIGNNLKGIVKSVNKQELSLSCLKDGLFPRLYNDLFTQRDLLITRYGIDKKSAMESQQIQNMLDMINALEVLAEGLTTADELIDRIDEIFPKRDKKSGIALSTIHKAKGLEANNVYVACKSLMPSKSAKKDWELKQEYNLMYVAYTRAKNILGFIDEKDFEKFTSGENSSNQLNKIETLVNSLYGKKPIYDLNNSNDVKTIVERIKDVQTNISSSSTINISNKNNENKINNFSDILKKKKRKTVRL